MRHVINILSVEIVSCYFIMANFEIMWNENYLLVAAILFLVKNKSTDMYLLQMGIFCFQYGQNINLFAVLYFLLRGYFYTY